MTPILSKCLEELKQTTPRIDYVIGLLEAVIEMNSAPTWPIHLPPVNVDPGQVVVPKWPPQATNIQNLATDDASILDATAKANIEKVKKLAQASTELQ